MAKSTEFFRIQRCAAFAGTVSRRGYWSFPLRKAPVFQAQAQSQRAEPTRIFLYPDTTTTRVRQHSWFSYSPEVQPIFPHAENLRLSLQFPGTAHPWLLRFCHPHSVSYRML